ncbi:MAG: peroxiredoxin [Proteobacteria bacterium]|nr:peroxiredoxin [Pseudomonadota bacterium]MBU0964754.1 peroxiredoxin [Pseudomonadota bacterium]
MAKSIGIFVTSPQNMRHVEGITKAAVAKGAKVKVFFTWMSAHLTKCPNFKTLCDMENVDVSICADSYKKCGYDVANIPAGLTQEKMATQAQHGAIIEDYECYLTL